MLTIGMLGGMSWESSAENYRLVNEFVRDRLGGLHAAAACRSRSTSLRLSGSRLPALGTRRPPCSPEPPGRSRRRRRPAGAVPNTMHKVTAQVQAAVTIPLLDLADVTAEAVLAAGLTTVGLLGTAFTMEQAFY
jgi:aspartate racemase